MSKAILISIKPKYVAKILNGEKTIVIRKTMPKCDLPIDVYIYCTKEENLIFVDYRPFGGCAYENTKLGVEGTNLSGKAVAKFTLNKVEEIKWELPNKLIFPKNMLENACLSGEELFRYLGEKGGCAIHISDLEIFDKPKELSEFKIRGNCKKCKSYCPATFWHAKKKCLKILTKAPQSWCYLEVE